MPNKAITVLLSRRSVRAYRPDPIPRETLAQILEAGQAAPYVQPDSRHFSVIADRGVIDRLNRSAIAEGVKISSFHQDLFSAPGFDGTYGAPVVILLAGSAGTVQYEAVCAASIQNMLIAATALGVSSCWAYFPVFAFHGTEADAWRTELKIPEGYRPCASVLLGYGANALIESDLAAPAEVARYHNSIAFIGCDTP